MPIRGAAKENQQHKKRTVKKLVIPAKLRVFWDKKEWVHDTKLLSMHLFLYKNVSMLLWKVQRKERGERNIIVG